jgi:hypothetical protein
MIKRGQLNGFLSRQSGEPAALTNLASLLGRLAARDCLAEPQAASQDEIATPTSTGSLIDPRESCSEEKEP